MALSRSLKMQSLKGDDIITTTFNRVNPNIDYAKLNTAMRKLNDLTGLTYLDTHVVDTQSLNDLTLNSN